MPGKSRDPGTGAFIQISLDIFGSEKIYGNNEIKIVKQRVLR